LLRYRSNVAEADADSTEITARWMETKNSKGKKLWNCGIRCGCYL